MGQKLRKRIRQESFATPQHEAVLSLLVASASVEEDVDVMCERFGITVAQYNVLRILRGIFPDGHARCDIIDRMIKRAPDVTRLIDRLVSAGYARRGKSEEDGRLSLTFITPKGIKLLDKMSAEMDAIDLRLAKTLSDRDAKTLTRLCEYFIPDEEKKPVR
jgi:DNA-binding MarR family transcriptional regulator